MWGKGLWFIIRFGAECAKINLVPLSLTVGELKSCLFLLLACSGSSFRFDVGRLLWFQSACKKKKDRGSERQEKGHSCLLNSLCCLGGLDRREQSVAGKRDTWRLPKGKDYCYEFKVPGGRLETEEGRLTSTKITNSQERLKNSTMPQELSSTEVASKQSINCVFTRQKTTPVVALNRPFLHRASSETKLLSLYTFLPHIAPWCNWVLLAGFSH